MNDLKNAIRRYNRRISKLNQSLPDMFKLEKETVSNLKQKISDSRDLKTIITLLNNTAKKNATNISPTYGIPNIIVKQLKADITLSNRRNRERTNEILKSYEKAGIKIDENTMKNSELSNLSQSKLT